MVHKSRFKKKKNSYSKQTKQETQPSKIATGVEEMMSTD
jgi:hypothetical protein